MLPSKQLSGQQSVDQEWLGSAHIVAMGTVKSNEKHFWTLQRKAFDPKLHGSHASFALLGNCGCLDLAPKYTSMVRSINAQSLDNVATSRSCGWAYVRNV